MHADEERERTREEWLATYERAIEKVVDGVIREGVDVDELLYHLANRRDGGSPQAWAEMEV